MAVDIKNTSYNINKRLGTNIYSKSLSADVIVPDSKPDVSKTISVRGKAMITNEKCENKTMVIEGNIIYYVIFSPEEEESNTQSVTGKIPFKIENKVDFNSNNINTRSKIYIKALTARVLNGRKLMIEAELESSTIFYSCEEIDLVTEVEGEKVQKQTKEVTLCSYAAKCIEPFNITETIELPQGKPPVYEILDSDVYVYNIEGSCNDSSLDISCKIVMDIMYKADDLDKSIQSFRCEIPFAKELNCNTDCYDATIIPSVNLFDCSSYPYQDYDGEYTKVSIEIKGEMGVEVYSKINVCTVDDAYSINEDFKVKKKEYSCVFPAEVINIETLIKESINFNIEESIEEVCRVYCKPIILGSGVQGNNLSIDGILEITILYTVKERPGVMCAFDTEIPFREERLLDENLKGCEYDLETSVDNCDYTITGDHQIEIRALLNSKIDFEMNYKFVGVNEITEIKEYKPVTERCEITIYFIQGNECIWDIAKKYRVTVDNLVIMNNLAEDEILCKGKKIYIPA